MQDAIRTAPRVGRHKNSPIEKHNKGCVSRNWMEISRYITKSPASSNKCNSGSLLRVPEKTQTPLQRIQLYSVVFFVHFSDSFLTEEAVFDKVLEGFYDPSATFTTRFRFVFFSIIFVFVCVVKCFGSIVLCTKCFINKPELQGLNTFMRIFE